MSDERNCPNCIHKREHGCEMWECDYSPKDDCISRQAVLDELDKWEWQELYLPIHFKENIIDVVPSVKPQEPKIGHWIKTPKAVMGEGYMWYCDKCEHQVYQDSSRPYPSEKYCPNCGARMVEPQESEE